MYKNLSLSILLSVTFFSCSKNIKNLDVNQKRNSYADLTAKQKDPLLKREMESKLIELDKDRSLTTQNHKLLSVKGALNGHTKLYKFEGKYKILVIPVQFSDVKFQDSEFFKIQDSGKSIAQDYLFGDNKNSMSQYYKHTSLGKFKLNGEVTSIVTIDKPLSDFGEAIAGGTNDKDAKGLVVAALKKLKKSKLDNDWWDEFDNWDLSDYDKDKNFHEPDGFIDAVVLIYAGKSQASCQSSFVKADQDIGSADVPPGPRHDATVECLNRIWPHRWRISLAETDPSYKGKNGPVIEGKKLHSSNGLKINDHLFASDYNMQSEFSDRSTFIHEFGHSLSLPDVYSKGKSNSTGSWEVMSSNASLQAQEMSTYSKLSLGWISPKIIKQGESTSAYLGAYNYVPNEQRNNEEFYSGVNLNENGESILSLTPDFNENVFRSILVLTEPTDEQVAVVTVPKDIGKQSAYSGRFNGETRSLKLNLDVPKNGNAELSFKTIYHIETQTNFNSKEKDIKVVTDYDIGAVKINGVLKEKLRLISGDENFDTLAEINPLCKSDRVLDLRNKIIDSELTEEETVEFKTEMKVCQKPIWVTKKYDLSKLRGQNIELEISLTTDPGYTEFGIVVDDIKIGDDKFGFEKVSSSDLKEFKILYNGKETISSNQFYLMEYRTPGEDYKKLSYNMDNNISVGTQSMFLDNSTSLVDNFRMITYAYKPGVLVWYFNSKYERSGNDPAGSNGKGYLLVLNSKLQEVKLPGLFENSDFFNEDGTYKDYKKDKVFGDFVKSQRLKLICFGYTKYATYLEGKAPDCSNEDQIDYMSNITFYGKSLQYRRERFNEELPINRYDSFGVGRAFRSWAGLRTGLSTFSPEESDSFAPYKIYKSINNKMVLDKEATDSAPKFKTVSSFEDKDSKFTNIKSLQGDTVVVEKKGFSFNIVSPSKRVLDSYQPSKEDSNENNFRRPRAKIYFNWN